MDPFTLACIQACAEVAGKYLEKGIQSLLKSRLSDSEKELLITAAPKGRFFVITVGQEANPWINAGGKDFNDSSDPAYAARYRDAFESLCKRGYVKHQRNSTFMLSGAGFDKARKLKQRNAAKDRE